MNAVSLFSGCLGLDLGLELAGIRTVLYVERDKACQRTIRLNRPLVPLADDVCEVNRGMLHRLLGRCRVDLIAGGPPCQSFSTIGKRASVTDERGRMLLEYLRIVGEVKPAYFLLENVRGILSARIDGRPLMPWLLSRFRGMGYCTRDYKLDATQFGVAQKRVRVIVLGSRVGGLPVLSPRLSYVKTLGDEIRDLEDIPGECASFSSRAAFFMSKIPEGGNWRHLPKRDQTRAMGNADLSSGGLTAFYRRLSYARPCATLLASPTQRATTLCHPTKTRPLSVAEYRRIQGFPDDWVLAGSIAQKYRQLGNAVPVKMAEAIGLAIVKNK